MLDWSLSTGTHFTIESRFKLVSKWSVILKLGSSLSSR